MSKYILTHGTFYEVPDNHPAQRNIKHIDLGPGEMAHFKYIKREKLPNGGYRYYYDDSEMKRAKAELKVAQQGAEMASEKSRALNYASEQLKDYSDYTLSFLGQGPIHSEAKKASVLSKNATKNAIKVGARYAAKAIATFPARAISKGTVKIANLFSKIFKK